MSYTIDLLNKNLGKDQSKWQKRRVPMIKDLDEGSDEESNCEKVQEEVTADLVRTAQRIVGELNWLVTRCRPDLMFVVSRMSALTTRHPMMVQKMATQLWMYLVSTCYDGIRYDADSSLDLVVYTDARYGKECHGCVIILWMGAPILWRSSRQSLVTTSTAAAEILEIMEGAVMTEAIRVVIEEIIGRATTWQWTDSQAALAIATGETASWRSRHFRKRAKFLRWKVGRGDLALRHSPGLDMLADLGTKPLQASRLQELREKMGMFFGQSFEPASKRAEGEKAVNLQVTENVKRLQMTLMTLMLVQAASQPDEEGDQKYGYELEIYTGLVMFMTLCGWFLVRHGIEAISQWHARRVSRPDGDDHSRPVPVEDRVSASPSRPSGPQGSDGREEWIEQVEISTSSDDLIQERQIFVTIKGTKFYVSRSCQGWRNASKVTAIRLCRLCGSESIRYEVPIDFRGRNLYSLGPRNLFHENASHGEAMHGEGSTSRFKVYSPCVLCAMSQIPADV